MNKLRLMKVNPGEGLSNQVICNKIKTLDQGEIMMFGDFIQVTKNNKSLLSSNLKKGVETAFGVAFVGNFYDGLSDRKDAFPIIVNMLKKMPGDTKKEQMLIFTGIHNNSCEVFFEVIDA